MSFSAVIDTASSDTAALVRTAATSAPTMPIVSRSSSFGLPPKKKRSSVRSFAILNWTFRNRSETSPRKARLTEAATLAGESSVIAQILSWPRRRPAGRCMSSNAPPPVIIDGEIEQPPGRVLRGRNACPQRWPSAVHLSRYPAEACLDGLAVTAREAMHRLRREGWSERCGKGSHVVFTQPGQDNVSVPQHRGDIPSGTLRSIYRAAGWEWPPRR